MRDGAPVVYVERGGRGIVRLVELSEEELAAAIGALRRGRRRRPPAQAGDRETRRRAGDRLRPRGGPARAPASAAAPASSPSPPAEPPRATHVVRDLVRRRKPMDARHVLLLTATVRLVNSDLKLRTQGSARPHYLDALAQWCGALPSDWEIVVAREPGWPAARFTEVGEQMATKSRCPGSLIEARKPAREWGRPVSATTSQNLSCPEPPLDLQVHWKALRGQHRHLPATAGR